ncbi:STAS domain-containing protein [Streptomyces sp. ST1015]|uniref:STAS domain-containing protein n=1 Tax=Streptomyces sp. ST1015 TaxID=1848900 RepID=UPI0029318DBF|nr:STAS domain-containing protein [Streptomyces sp. ST1015]
MTPPANPHARTRSSGRFTVVEVTGEIDLATADLLAEHLDAASRRKTPDVLVDLRRVEFFDCSGLRALCRAEERARRRPAAAGRRGACRTAAAGGRAADGPFSATGGDPR